MLNLAKEVGADAELLEDLFIRMSRKREEWKKGDPVNPSHEEIASFMDLCNPELRPRGYESNAALLSELYDQYWILPS